MMIMSHYLDFFRRKTWTVAFRGALRALAIAAACFLSAFSLRAQQYPVVGNLQVIAPYPGWLADYANAGGGDRVNLNLTNILPDDAGPRVVRLKLYIEKGNSLVAYSSDGVGSRSEERRVGKEC